MKRKRHSVGRVSFTLRLPGDLVSQLDVESRESGLSRTQLVERLLRYAIAGWKTGKLAESQGLFRDIEADIERAIQNALRQAVREGGVDLALHWAEQVRKSVKRGGKS